MLPANVQIQAQSFCAIILEGGDAIYEQELHLTELRRCCAAIETKALEPESRVHIFVFIFRILSFIFQCIARPMLRDNM